jgi:hypothetical protein
VPLVVTIDNDKLEKSLVDHSLPGGVFYVVNTLKNVKEVNHVMERVRKYRIMVLQIGKLI